MQLGLNIKHKTQIYISSTHKKQTTIHSGRQTKPLVLLMNSMTKTRIRDILSICVVSWNCDSCCSVRRQTRTRCQYVMHACWTHWNDRPDTVSLNFNIAHQIHLLILVLYKSFACLLHFLLCSFFLPIYFFAFSALTLLVGWQEGHPTCKKNWAVGCWCGYLSGERCRLACVPADATATHCLLLQ